MPLSESPEELIVRQAQEWQPAERARFLDAICGQDAFLRQRVQALLAAQAEAKDELGPTVVDSQAQTPNSDVVVEEGPGTVIGRYRLLEKVGEGGFGEVYVAEQKEPVKRRVALKVIKLGMDTKQVVARFEAERQALALMDHPNIAKVLDGGATHSGRPYFVMELVRGIPITQHCDQNHVPTEQRLKVFIQVCQAVQHAHQKGIIHRDIKPSNILVTVSDGVAVPKVIDFGIAKAAQGGLTDKTVYTQLQQFIGTPAYMSPEQAEMSAQDIDTRSDIYSLGVLLYELLVGRTPFDPRELLASGLEAKRRIIREKEPMRPSTRLGSLPEEEKTTTAKRRAAEAPRLVNLLRGDLDWIVMKCLEKDRTRRYETANGLAMDLQRHLGNEPVVARPPSAAYRMQKLVRRHKLTFAAAGAVMTALILGVVFSTWQAIRARQAERHARVEAQRASQSEATAKEQSAAAKEQRRRAEAGESAARQRELEARRNLYASDMNLANEALEAKNVGYALELLDRHRPEPGQPDLRGWEWRYLWKQTRSDALQTLGAHSDTVYDVVFSPKGDRLATCSSDGTVKLWDMGRRREIANLPHGQSVRTAVFLNEGKGLATASADGLLRVWDVASLKEVGRLPVGTIGRATGQSGLAFSPRGEFVAVAEPDGTVNVWNLGTKAKTATLRGKQNASCLAFSWDAQVLAVGYRADPLVGVFDVARQQGIYTLTNGAVGVSALAFSRDGRMLACAGWDMSREGPAIRVWDLSTRQRIWTLSGHTSWIPELAFSPDGKTLASAGSDHTARLWDVDTGQSTTLRGHLNEVWAIAVAPDGQSLITGTKIEGRVTLWSTLPKPAQINAQVISSDVENVRRGPRLSPDGTALLKVYDDKVMSLWDTDTLTERTRFSLAVGPRTHLAISPGGKLIGRGDADGSLRLLEVATGHEAAILSQHGAGVEGLAFSRHGSKLVVASADRKIRIWDVATQKMLHEIDGHPSGVVGYGSALAFSADGLTLGVGYEDDTAELFDARGGKRLALLRGHKGPVCGAILLPDSKTAVTGSYDQAVKLWDVATQRDLGSLHGEALSIFSIALSPDGQRLAAGGGEGRVRLWDPAGRQLVTILKVPQGEGVDALAFSPDGNALVAITTTLLRVWRAPSLAEIEVAEKRAEGSTQ